MNARDNHLVADYLRQLRAAASILPADRADELVGEITSHIAEARAAAADGGSTSVRNILERLGDPADIVRTAAEPGALSPQPGAAGDRGTAARAGAHEVIAVILLLVGGLVIPVIGWVVGVILLWNSPRWQTREKLLGTLVWPGGLAAPIGLLVLGGVAALTTAGAQVCAGAPSAVATGTTTTGQQVVQHLSPAATCSSASATAPWLFITIAVILMALAIAGPIYTAIRLMRRAGRPVPGPAADPAPLLTA